MLVGERLAFLILLVVNTLVALLYLLWMVLVDVPVMQKKDPNGEQMHDNRRTFLIKFLVMLLCPVVGPLFFLFSHILYLVFFPTAMDLDDVIFSKERVKIQLKADEERGRNMVPMEEALLVNGAKDMRLVMMNTLKGEVNASLATIAMALNSEDSESSHYAASVLSDGLNDFRLQVQKLLAAMEDEPQEETGCEELLIDYMNGILCQQIFTRIEQANLVRKMAEIAEKLYQKNPARLDGDRYENICLRLLEIEDFETSEKWCLRLTEQHPDQLCAFTCRLKLYFTSKNREAFFETLSALKSSEVVIDNETLELIRIFS
ncbi:MAG: hypothetical protein HFG27_03250 [Provencibacterium sp.]|jgi:hypothetical protein|nr:hypothetical protein [Provencibacterium sp.]